MIVRDLILELELMPEDAEVMYAYDYGDHWHTEVAEGVDYVEEQIVSYSGYHSMWKVLGDETNEHEENKTVVILK